MGHQMVDFIADYFRDLETYPVQSQVQVRRASAWQYRAEFVPSMKCCSESLARDGHSGLRVGAVGPWCVRGTGAQWISEGGWNV